MMRISLNQGIVMMLAAAVFSFFMVLFSPAYADIVCNGSSCDPHNRSSASYSTNENDNANYNAIVADLEANGFSSSEAQAMAKTYVAQGVSIVDDSTTTTRSSASANNSGVNNNTVVGGTRVGVGRGGDTSVNITSNEREAASSAIAPSVIMDNANECYWTFSFSAAGQTVSGGGSAGVGLFPTRLATCMKFMLADRYAAGYANNPEAARLMREIEESLR